jgi:hypothetical protein
MAIQTATASFTASSTPQAITWPAMTGNFGVAAAITVTDGNGPVGVWLTARSASGATVNVSDAFTGTVDLVIYDRL